MSAGGNVRVDELTIGGELGSADLEFADDKHTDILIKESVVESCTVAPGGKDEYQET